MLPIRRFYTPASSSNTGAAGSLGSRLGGLAGSTYERVGEEHPHPHPHLADLAEHHITGAFHAAPNLHQPHPPPTQPADTTDTEDDANAEAAVIRRRNILSHPSNAESNALPSRTPSSQSNQSNRPLWQSNRAKSKDSIKEKDEKAAAMGAVGPDGLPILSLLEKAKFYTSLCFGTTAILAVFGFLFLIPFIVDPAISSLAADFDPKPVTCVVASLENALGLRNCTWSSCREGCTTAALKCTLVRVNYSRHYFDDKPIPDLLEFNVTETKFFVNTEGCGYPPRVNCTEFAKKMALLSDKPFPCYVSNTYPDLVVAEYSWDKTVRNLVLALVAPPLVFGFTVGVLIFWYCPACSKEKQESFSTAFNRRVKPDIAFKTLRHEST